MEAWLVCTIAAAFFQNARSLMQRRLTGTLSVNGASYVRFLYALPFALIGMLFLWGGVPTGVTVRSLAFVSAGGLAQIIATSCLLASFAGGNFAMGTAYSKTEAAQAALVGLVLLGDTINIWVACGIAVSLVGVIALSGNVTWQDLRRPNRSMWLGLASGAAFAVSVVCFRAASLGLESGSFLERAGLSVMMAVIVQTLMLSAYLRLREPGEITRVFGVWRQGFLVGVFAAAASIGWFSAITLENAAVVRAVGQIELLFTVATSVWLLGERIGRRQLLGMALVVAGIALLVNR